MKLWRVRAELLDAVLERHIKRTRRDGNGGLQTVYAVYQAGKDARARVLTDHRVTFDTLEEAAR